MPRGRGSDHRGRGRGIATSSRSHLSTVNSFAALDSNGEMNASLSERFRGATRHPNTLNAVGSTPNNGLAPVLIREIREYVAAQEKIVPTDDKEEWLTQPEIPTRQELSTAVNELFPNKIRSAYKNKERYLRVQYTLLREDAVGSLREAILDFSSDPTTDDTTRFSVYDQVHVVGYTFARRGLAARIKFSTRRAGKRINWANSKRLVSGSIVALVPTKARAIDLSEIVVAVVAARPLAGVMCDPPEIDVYFGRTEDIQLDPQKEWLMIEAKQGYFEAYRHTLRALQKLSQEKFPLSETICRLSTSDGLPAYMKESPILDMSAAATDPIQKKELAKVNITQEWPSAPSNSLDNTQWAALKEILTKPLAIVQGPPGTGKTYVSRIAVEILHANRKAEDPPIIIAAQTNHALDQLLGYISRFEPNYVRLGGRSTKPEVKKRALFEIRQAERIKPIPGGMLGKSNSFLEKQIKGLTQILEPLVIPGVDLWSTDEVTGPKILQQLGVLTTEQAKSLEDGATQWVSATTNVEGPIKLWLDKTLLPFEVDYAKESYGFEEVDDDDLEFEQLRENEDSNGVNDEEDIEMLKGPWRELRDRWKVPEPSTADLGTAAKLLDTTTDMWKIPDYFRGPVYHLMQLRAKAKITAKFRQEANAYNKIVKDILVGKWEQDAVYLKRAPVIGMTTTGLSKYRALISALKPKVILIEEAAEVLEAPVTVACIESLEHLILVGDHQQLQGHCSVQELENDPFYLNVSLFERLVINKMPFKTLLQQRRMMPEFRRLIEGIYPELTDHQSVVERQLEPWGMGEVRSFFFNHEWWEQKDESLSTVNVEEARFVAGFYRYLRNNGIDHSRITVLTFYNGQRKRLLRELKVPGATKAYVNVKTVDSYQGEENDIVILSLARNNQEGKIGFLDNMNRVCVALSRAKYGFYIFGNSEILMKKSVLWSNVLKSLKDARRYGPQLLPVMCIRHRTTTVMQYPEDWTKTDGGCARPCGDKLSCGHPCRLRCHPYSHDNIECDEDCNKTLPCGHGCSNKCGQLCFCTYEAFEKSQNQQATQEVPNPGDTTGNSRWMNQDIRGPQNDGQEDSPHGSASYLPQQELPSGRKNWLVLPISQWGPANDVANPTENRSVRTGYRTGGGPWNPNPQATVQASRMSPEKQGQVRRDWHTFAKGGHVAHNTRLRLATPSMPPLFNGGTRPGQGGMRVPGVQKETVTAIGNGRMRYVQEYQPGPSRNHNASNNIANHINTIPTKVNNPSSSSKNPQNRFSKKTPAKAVSQARTPVTTHASSSQTPKAKTTISKATLDDLMELEPCFSDS